MQTIIESRIIPDISSKRNIRRERLLKLLSENIDKNLILVCGPAGYGKTTLVRDFVTGPDKDFSWLRVHSDMDSFFTFIDYFIHSLAKVNSSFGKDTGEIINSYREKNIVNREKSVISDITGVLINEFCRCFTKEIVAVIDDLGNIGNPEWLNTAFNIIFENIPANLHFIITTRQVPDFNIGTLLAKRNVFKLETKDLTFEENEVKELLAEIYGLSSTEEDAKQLKINMDGWITGIHLILQAYGMEFKKIKLDKKLIHEDIFNYFTEDIFNSLDDDIKEFLLNSSLLDSFTNKLCEAVLGNKNSKKIIRELQTRNIFIQANTDSEGNISYSYQVFFKHFLDSKLQELKSESEINEFYKNVYLYYLENKDYISAIRYSLLGKEFSSAIPLIISHFRELFDNGKYEILSKWFEELDEELVLQDEVLLYFKSNLVSQGDLKTALDYLDKSIKLSEKKKNITNIVKCKISKASILIRLGNIKDAIALLRKNDGYETSNENKARILYLNAYAYYLNAQYDESLTLLDRAIKTINESEISNELKDTKIDIFNLYGHIFLIRGEYSKSISYYEHVSRNAQNIIDKYETDFNLILLYAQSGRFEKAYEYVELTGEIPEKIPVPILMVTFLLAVQSFKFEFGEYEESIRLLEQMNIIAAKLGHKYYIFLSYSLIGDSYYYLNRLSKSEEYYDFAFTYMNENNELEKIQYAFTKAILLKKSEITESLESVLLDAYKYYDANMFIYNKMQAAFHLADYYLKTVQLNQAYKYLSECLTVSKEKEYYAFLEREYMDSVSLFDFALANNIEKGFVKMIIDETISKQDTGWISNKTKIELQKISEKLYDVNIKAFGTGSITIRGKLLPETEWRKKKWKYILLYLFISSNKELTKDKLIDIFYPDYSLENSDNIFHQVISKFRSLIKAEINAEQSGANLNKPKSGKTGSLALISPLVTYEDKVVKLNKNFNFKIDTNEFEKINSAYILAKHSERKIEYAKSAISIYKGEFLEGLYDHWCEELRNKYKTDFINLSEGLIELLYNNKRYDEILYYSEKLLKYDKMNEKAFEYVIKTYIFQNKLNLAREKYYYMQKLYKSELGDYNNPLNEKLKSLLK